jgi:hypothetical protein
MIDPLRRQMAAIALAFAQGRYRYTIHGAQQRIARGIQRQEIEEAIAAGEIIEDYPTHHYGPACLILGQTNRGKALHLLCSVQPMVDLVTVYEPDPHEWERDLKTRRPKS